MSDRTVLIALASLCLVSACSPDGAKSASPTSSREAPARRYSCPMHPSYRVAAAGDCPMCNMALVADDGDAAAEAPDACCSHDRVAITLSERRQQLIGVRSEPVVLRKASREVPGYGRFEVDPRRRARLVARFSGYVEKLHVRTAGEVVAPGTPLFEIRSHELFDAQNYYVGAEMMKPDKAGLSKARERLRFLGMAEADIVLLEQTRVAERVHVFRSPVGGTVLSVDLVERAMLMNDEPMLEIADLGALWLSVDLLEADLPLVTIGTEASIVLRDGSRRSGRVSLVAPVLDEATRTARARIEVDNGDGRLKPGMLADVTFAVDLGERLTIDDEAVIDMGRRKLAFVATGDGRFEPREIELGHRSDGRSIVLSGLLEGERVVTRATFLVDSESRLQALARASATDPTDAR